ncbi:MAG: DUF222 domain-containing protein [Proteobacteria bacterium]|nr:DUF222 domain-containing protein [Pseudomonadota bacterium]
MFEEYPVHAQPERDSQNAPDTTSPENVFAPIHEIVAANRQRRAECAVLEQQILTLAGQINAMNYRFLELLHQFDEKGGWEVDGVKSFAHWLNWKCSIGTVAAREKVRVARALPGLPLIAGAFRCGEISYSKVRAMTRVATAENESLLLEYARYGTAAHIEQICGRYQRCRQLNSGNEHCPEEPRCSTWQDDDGMVHIHVVLPADEGELVIQAVEKMLAQVRAEQENVSAETEPEDVENVSAETSRLEPFDFPANRAFSLARIAEHYLASTNSAGSMPSSDRYQVVLHVNANEQHRDHVITGGPCCYLAQNRFLSPQVARQLACDATLTVVSEDDEGNVLDISRRSRRISRAMRLALAIRDGGCRFPSCHQTAWTDAHHIHHWADGGATSLDNLVTLCRHHHRLLHRGDFAIRKSGSEIEFFRKAPEYPLPRGFSPQFEPTTHENVIGSVDLDPENACIEINETTALTLWDGGPWDLGQAIEGLYQQDRTRLNSDWTIRRDC